MTFIPFISESTATKSTEDCILLVQYIVWLRIFSRWNSVANRRTYHRNHIVTIDHCICNHKAKMEMDPCSCRSRLRLGVGWSFCVWKEVSLTFVAGSPIILCTDNHCLWWFTASQQRSATRFGPWFAITSCGRKSSLARELFDCTRANRLVFACTLLLVLYCNMHRIPGSNQY